MSTVKTPASLRRTACASVSSPSPQRLAMITAATLTAASPAAAQTADANGFILLPTVEVETAAPAATTQPAPRQPRKTAAAAPSDPVAAPPAETAVEETASSTANAAGTNGTSAYADPDAPYTALSSGNSLLRQPLSQTARTVTAVTQEVLADKNATSVRELARTTPGLTLGTGEGGNAFGDVLFIRGFRASNDMFVDGQRNAGVSVSETFNAEQVEVTKGPTGSIAGRGTTGGAVNIVTKSPQNEDFLLSQTTVGSADLYRQTLDWNKVWSDRFRTRVNLMAQSAGVAGRDDVEDDRRGLSVAAEYDATDDLTVSVDLTRSEFHGIPDWGVPWDGANDIPFTEAAAGRPKLDRSTFYGNTARDFHDATQTMLTFGVGYEVAPDVMLNSRLRIAESINDYVVTAPERPDITDADPANWTLTASPKSRYQVNNIISSQNELSFDAATGNISHDLVIGLEVTREEVDQQSYQGLTSESGGGTAVENLSGCSLSIYAPDVSTCANPALVRNPAVTQTNVTSRSLYIGDVMELRDDLILNLGTRIDNYKITRSTATSRLSREDTFFNWNAGLTYRLNDQGMVYASYATSTDPMGQSLDAGGGSYSGLDARNVNFAPEENTAFEIGTKWEVNGLSWTAALYQTTKENAIETSGRGPSATASDTGKYRIRGLELGVSGNVTDKLSLYGSANWMQSKVLQSADSSNIGAELANIAHEQINLLANYQVNDRWNIGGQATWRGELMGGSLTASNGNTLPSYWRFDAFTQYEIGEGKALTVRVDNLTDEVYYDAFYRSGTPFVYVAPGRSVTASLDIKF